MANSTTYNDEFMCFTCSDGGYLNLEPTVYCDCSAGAFYETVDEIAYQKLHEELDIDYSNNTSAYFVEEYFINDDDANIYFFMQLPFFENAIL